MYVESYILAEDPERSQDGETNSFISYNTEQKHQCHCRGRHDCGSNSKVKVSIGGTGVPNLSGRQWKLGVKARVALEANSTITETADLCDRCSSKI